MDYNRIIKHMTEDGNCYVKELPPLAALEKDLGYKITAKSATDGDGYILEREVEVVKKEKK